jgi:poly-gamma-glutamate synthesis protein (capsule biosynthesis protein)
LRVVLMGQALLQHDLTDAQWPAANKFRSFVSGADAVFTDLETAIKGRYAEAPVREGTFLHAADARIVDRLANVGINLFATANNHAYDFGPGGIRDALDALEARHLAHAGTGMTLAKAAAPGLLATEAGTVALVAMASGSIAAGGMATANKPGVNEVRRGPGKDLDEADVGRYLASIKTAAASADIVIAYQHNHYWEKDMADTPPWQRTLARRAIDAGASIFAAHGAPLLHGIEIYKGRPIFYDLGGLFFQTVTKPGYYPPEVWQSVVVDCRCTKAGFERISLTAVQLNDTGTGGPADMTTRGMPRLAEGTEGKPILQRLARLSENYGTRFTFTPRGADIVIG